MTENTAIQIQATLNSYHRARLNFGVFGGLIGLIIAIVVLAIYLPNAAQSDIPLVRINGFAEWDSFAAKPWFDKHPCPNTTPESPEQISCDGLMIDIIKHNLRGVGVILQNLLIPSQEATDVKRNFFMTAYNPHCGTNQVLSECAKNFLPNYQIQPALHIAWLFRLITVIIFAVSAIFYRQLLGARYLAQASPLSYRAFTALVGGFDLTWVRAISGFIINDNTVDLGESSEGTLTGYFSFLLTILVTMLIAYILMTLIWMPFSLMFVGLSLNIAHTGMLVLVYGGLLGFMMMYLLVAADTKEVLTYSIMAIAVGLIGIFILANNAWWQGGAISSTSVDDSTASLFSFVLAMIAIMLGYHWYDLSKLNLEIIQQFEPIETPVPFIVKIADALIGVFWLVLQLIWKPLKFLINRIIPKKWTRKDNRLQNDFYIINCLVSISIIAIFMVGVFPNTNNFPAFNTIHNAAAYIGLGLFTLITKIAYVQVIAKKYLPYQLAVIAVIMFLLDSLFLCFRFLMPVGIRINTTAFELWVMLSTVVWIAAVTMIILETINTAEKQHSDGYSSE